MRPALILLLGMMLLAANVLAQDADPTAAEPAIASVNGALISRGEFERTLARITSDTPVAAADSDALEIEVLNALVEQELISQFAERQNIRVSDREIEAEIEHLQESLGDTAWGSWLADNLYSEADFRAAIHDQIVTGRVRDEITANLHGLVEHVRARHILVTSPTAARAVLISLENGADFAALAAQVSLDVTSKDTGGDLGWFARGELLDESLADIAFSTEPGIVTGPVASSLGYHILETLDKAHRSIEAARLPSLIKSIFERWLTGQVQAAEIIFNL